MGDLPVRQYHYLETYVSLDLGSPRVSRIVGPEGADPFWIGHDVAAWFSGQRQHDRSTDDDLRGRRRRVD